VAKVRGGYNTYGESIGIIMFEREFPRIPGDMGNATTFPFPIRFEVVPGATGERARRGDRTMVPDLIEGARALERAGVKAITTTCGYLALFQRELVESVKVPLYSSSLMQVPLIAAMLRPDQRVGVLTSDAKALQAEHFEAAGADPKRVVWLGLEDEPAHQPVRHNLLELDPEALGDALARRATTLVAENPDVGAIVLECANHPPYGWRVQQATGLMVFDFTTFTTWVHAGAVRRQFQGHL
jgi:Asp/Glu/Hydantoin racemase